MKCLTQEKEKRTLSSGSNEFKMSSQRGFFLNSGWNLNDDWIHQRAAAFIQEIDRRLPARCCNRIKDSPEVKGLLIIDFSLTAI